MNEKINKLIEYYITLRREDPKNENEVYKWYAIDHFQQQWDINAVDFYEMFKESFRKRGNLVYQNSFSFLDALGKYFPEQLRNLFIIVYSSDDFYIKLDKAKNFAENSIEKLREKLNKTNFNHQFDERTLSFLLTMQNPSENTFYKSTLYNQLCDYLDIIPQKERKYKHHIELLFQMVPFLNNPQLNLLKEHFVPKGVDFPLLLAQDIVYQNMNNENEDTKRYWLYSPGEQAVKWEEFYNEGIMAIGWDELGDLENYTDRKSILEALINNYGGGEDQRNNVSAIDDFCNGENKINKGDIVIAKKGTKTLLGYGKVISDYYFDEERATYKHYRKVKWLKKGVWDANNNLPTKTLTDVTTYNSDIEGIKYAQYLLNIMNGNTQAQENNLIIKLLKYKPQIILQGPPGTGKTREAKRIAKALLGLGENDSLEGNEQFKLIQFHPSYSYEDFVRGIIAENTNGNISYVTKDKILAEFATKAFKAPLLPIKWEDFRDFLEKERKEKGDVYFDGDSNLKYESIKDGKLFYSSKRLDTIQYNEDTGEITELNDRNFDLVGIHIEAFCQKNLDDNFISFKKSQKKQEGYWNTITDYFIKWANNFKKKKPYVLVIDEINRANLSAVLGELIYALEYRGEAVQSMYAIEGENNLILPPNLYIIGTMNTADRSVGHIDYAIRRRFAFVNVLPNELEKDFHKELFRAVSELFISNYDEYISNPDIELKRALTLSNEFKSEDVWLGHSYFITKNTPIDIRWEYEIKPILLEYIKDGILINDIKIGEQMQKIKKIVYENNAS
jgi:ATPase associated with various cellular activities AAA_5